MSASPDPSVRLPQDPTTASRSIRGARICRGSPDCSGLDETCTPIHTAGASDTTYTDTGLSNLTEYCYQAYAFDGNDNLATPAEAHAVPYDGNPFWWSYTAGAGAHDTVQRLHVDTYGNLLISALHNSGSTAHGHGTGDTSLSYDLSDYRASIDFGGGSRPYSNDDMVLIKLDKDGNYLWDRVPYQVCDSEDRINGIGTDSEGNIYLGGAYGYATIQFDESVPVETSTLNGNWDKDAFLVKLNSDGEFQWRYVYDASGGEKAWGLDVNEEGDTFFTDGNVYVVGRFDGSANFGGGDRVADSQDFFVVKLDPYGGYLWDYTAGGNYYDFARELVGLDDALFVTGTFESDGVDFGGGTVWNSANPIQSSMHMVEGDYFILKLDLDGNFVEVRTPLSGGTGVSRYGEDFARAITSSPNNNAIYVGGHYSDPIDFGGGTTYGQGGRDIFVMKMTP